MPDIIDLGPDDIIESNGFYRCPISLHHGQPCMSRERLAEIQKGDPITPDDQISVTSGVLRTMELATPADVWAFSLLNPDRYERPETAALRMGRAMAAYVEGGMDEVKEHFTILPEDKPRKPTAAQIEAYDENRATEAGKKSVEFWRRIDASPNAPLSDAEAKLIQDMGAALARDPGAVAVMGGEPEVTMAVRDERTGLWLLARPDTVSFDGMASDFKKMNTQGRPFNHRLVDQRITQHGYPQQMAFAADAFEALTGDQPGVVVIVAQCDSPPYHVILREILDEDLRIASFQNRRAIDRFAECLASRDFPGPGADTSYYQRPEWQRTMLLEEMNISGTSP